jgi:hypothetical protein
MIPKCYAEKGEILIKEQIYTLTPTQNKRELIIKNNQIIDWLAYATFPLKGEGGVAIAQLNLIQLTTIKILLHNFYYLYAGVRPLRD